MTRMPEPIVFVSHFRVREGKLEPLKQGFQANVQRLRSEKPRTLLFLGFFDESTHRVTFVHAFADAHALDLHFEGAGERTRAAYELIEPEGWEFYGTPSDRVMDAMRREAAAAGVPLLHQPAHLGGFVRYIDGASTGG